MKQSDKKQCHIKTILILVMAAVLCCGAVCAKYVSLIVLPEISLYVASPIEYIAFTVTADNRDMIGYTDATTALEIPATFQSTKEYDADGDGVVEPVGTWYKVVGIGSNAFAWNITLTSVKIPEGVTRIGSSAFTGNCYLSRITLPSTITEIGTGAFPTPASWAISGADGSGNWYSLSTGEGYAANAIPTGVADTYVAVKPSVYDVLITGANRDMIGYTDESTTLTIPASFTSNEARDVNGDGVAEAAGSVYNVVGIDKYAFSGCENLTSVTILEGATSIGEGSFTGCSGLTSISLPESVTNIGAYAFNGCTSLTSISIPEGVTTIEGMTFSTSGLTSIEIPGSVTNIGSSAFAWCKNLTSVVIHEGVTTIEDGAFTGNHKLTSITLPSTLTEIAATAFKLESVDVIEYKWYSTSTGASYNGDEIPTGVADTYVAAPVNSAAAILYSDGTMVFQEDNTEDPSHGAVIATYYGWEDRSYEIGYVPWIENMDLITNVVLSDGISPRSTDGWFYGASNLTEITIADGTLSNVLSMSNMFYGCSKLSGTFDFGTPASGLGNSTDGWYVAGMFEGVATEGGAYVLVTGDNDDLVSAAVSSRLDGNNVYMKMNERTLTVTPETLEVTIGGISDVVNISYNIAYAKRLHNADISWVSSDPTIIQVTVPAENAGPSITALKEGTATITCSLTDLDGTVWSKSCVVTVKVRKLVGIKVTVPPNKTEYREGEYFDPTGMVITATYDDGTTMEITSVGEYNDVLTADQTELLISYTENGITKTDYVSITISQELKA